MRRRIFPDFIGDVAKIEQRQAILERILQVIGFSPENPYTLTVNDGTLNRVLIGKINGDYGIKIVNDAGETIVFADGHITADGITTGTIDADVVNVVNIHADEITVGFLSASRIQGGVLDFDNIVANNIKANEITVGVFSDFNSRLASQAIHGGKIQVGTLNANRIVADSIDVDQIKAHIITTDEMAYRNVDGNYVLMSQTVRNRALYADINASKIITGTLDASIVNVNNLDADNIVTGTLAVGGSGKVNLINFDQSGVGDAFLRWSGGSRIWSDPSNYLGFKSNGGRLYFYAGDGLHMLLQAGEKASFYSGISISGGGIHFSDGEHNIDNIDSLIGYNDIRYVLGNNGYYHSFANAGFTEHLWISPDGGIWGHGNMHFDGSKYFMIQHPEDKNKYIQYASVESPEVALKIRGIAKLNSGEATITLPHHWELVTENQLTTVQLTPLEDCKGLFAPKSSLKNTSFKVKELQGGTSNIEFCWELTAIRKGYADHKVEPTKDEILEERVKKVIKMEEEDKGKTEEDRTQRSLEELPLFKRKYKEFTGKTWKVKPPIDKKWKIPQVEDIEEENNLTRK